jgi:hypothetical protein
VRRSRIARSRIARPRSLVLLASISALGALVLAPSAGGAATAPNDGTTPAATASTSADLAQATALAAAQQPIPDALCAKLLKKFNGHLPKYLARHCGTDRPFTRPLPANLCAKLLRVFDGHLPKQLARRCASP